MDDIREDALPEQRPASAGVGKPEPGQPRVVKPESEDRGGPEAPEETLPAGDRSDR